MKTLYVLFDADCGFCRRCWRWLEGQPQYVRLAFFPRNSMRAAQMFPRLVENSASDELIVVSNEGDVWRDSSAYVMCLWALKRYRSWAIRFSKPALRPLVWQFFELISRHRKDFSRWMGTSEQLHQELGKVQVIRCAQEESSSPAKGS